jgi:hypothetical protein
MEKLKYIVDDYGQFMVFSPLVIHKHAVRLLEDSTRGVVVGAGFIDIGPRGVTCFGRSESLGVASRKEDAIIIAGQMGFPVNQLVGK